MIFFCVSRRLWTDRYSVRFSCSPAGIFISNYFWEFHILYGESSSKKLWKSERMITTRLNWVWEFSLFFLLYGKFSFRFSSLCRICSEWLGKVVESGGIRETHVLGILQFSLFYSSTVSCASSHEKWLSSTRAEFQHKYCNFRSKKKAKLNSRRRRVVIVCRLNMYQVGIRSHHSHTHTALKSGLGWIVKRQFPQFSHSLSLSPMAKSVALRGFRVELRKFINISQTPALSSLFYALCARRSGRRGRWRWLSELDNSELLIWRQCP